MSQSFDIHEIFPSFQGEGPNAGDNAVFVRFGRCNLTCKFCDTNNNIYQSMPLSDIVSCVEQAANFGSGLRIKFVVITGGEPFLQPLEYLCDALLALNYKVQIETNGRIFRELDEQVEIVCSPKNVGDKFIIDSRFLNRLTALKFIVSKTFPGYQTVPDIGQVDHKILTYVQPMDENCPRKNADNLQLAREICLERGYRLSLQLHKLVGVR